MVRRSFHEGDWFAVPLENYGFAVGIIARASTEAGLLGYFFGPRVPTIPDPSDLKRHRADEAVLVGVFSHLGIERGDWPLIGRTDEWDRSAWPMPVFIREEMLTGRKFRVIYDPDDPSRRLRHELVRAGEDAVGPEDGGMGAEFVQARLTRLVA